MQIMLESMGYETKRIPDDSAATAEGVNFIIAPEIKYCFQEPAETILKVRMGC
ncbi:MAG: hypothetical protein Ct9H300mP18_13220 [Candidatus Neomarinimicrobiota bacterium]|nr:MAG: hypothetical protein Ct9H300mP18_13220 [Candidatus Neomarinimicrobiota bacterium]